MTDFVKLVSSIWPAIALVAVVLGGVLAWLFTRDMRKRASKVAEHMVDMYEKTIASKDMLANTLSAASSKQIELLTIERKEYEERHAAIAKEYQAKVHALRNELQSCTAKQAEHMMELAELRARTDFQPVMKFQEQWYKESSETNKMLVGLLEKLVGEGKAVDVHVINESHDAIPAVIQPTPAK